MVNLPLVKKKHGIAQKSKGLLENDLKIGIRQVILLSTEKFVCLVMSSLIINVSVSMLMNY
jgi:hypothetical protein